MTLGVIILAAGEGTRMRSALPKVLHPLCGRPMLGYILAVADALAAAHTAIVLAPATIDTISARFGSTSSAHAYHYVPQAERLGTGHAVMQARTTLVGRVDEVLVMLGDTPLLQAESTQQILAARRAAGALVGILSFHPQPPTGYGRIVRDAADHVAGIVEERAATPEERTIGECNSGVLCFDANWLWEALANLPPNPASGEYYLTDLVAQAIAERGPGAAVAIAVDDAREAWGVNDRAQLAAAEAVLHERILAEHMRAGVTIVNPAATTIDHDVQIGRDTTLLPGCVLRGATHIDEQCEIGPHTTLNDAQIGTGARVRYALVEGTHIPAGADIGPFVHLIDILNKR